jgi:hypothetical protein
MTGGDAIRDLQAFIDERWAVAQPRFYPSATEGPRVPAQVTANEAAYFLASVAIRGPEPPLFIVDDDRKVRSDRYPPKADGAPRGFHFFEEPGRLRLETIVHMAAMARLHDDFGWPREHLIIGSPDVVGQDGSSVLRREALDILLLENACARLPSKMPISAARSRVGVEVKAHADVVDKLLQRMQACQMGHPVRGHSVSDHKKCRAIEVLRPSLVLGVAAAETWRVFTVDERDGRAVLGEPRDLDCLHFKR